MPVLSGKLHHLNCDKVTSLDDVPRFIEFVCEKCGVDISNKPAVPTYQQDDGVFYSVEIDGHFVEIGKEDFEKENT